VVSKRAGPGVHRRLVVWVVTDADGPDLGAVLSRLTATGSIALREGRVFVDGRRARSPRQRVATGQRVELFAPRLPVVSARVLDERAGLVAVSKPAGMPTEPDRRGQADSLIHRLADELGANPRELHALTRLDLAVSGVVLVARTGEARRLALAARESGKLLRRYLAQAAGPPPTPSGVWNLPVAARRRSVGAAREAQAETRFTSVARADGSAATCRFHGPEISPTLLAVEPVTGRKHQIRVHASLAGCALLGDRSHGGPHILVHRDGRVHELPRIMLHAARVQLVTPDGVWRVLAPVPDEMVDLWRKLGGRMEDFDLGLRGDQL
jgi:23S rRNA-/tRNA-specific pseudouridylate synthase